MNPLNLYVGTDLKTGAELFRIYNETAGAEGPIGYHASHYAQSGSRVLVRCNGERWALYTPRGNRFPACVGCGNWMRERGDAVRCYRCLRFHAGGRWSL